ncbi:hypothetical protein N7510_010180 [Penicillium lagena]|uniref:uncharacterized protein n=1 Tax=Penicillium lagena TaxID=94218 RepID=UPI00253F8E4F|nr:uncharacterized protein N7510_010180 [Penicillium lagena]KAJ5605026.1 hypothetical protein N7510_010180 [Penicillium lagena]
MAAGTGPYAYIRSARHACFIARNEPRPRPRALLPLPPRHSSSAASRTITSLLKVPNIKSPNPAILCHSSGNTRDRRLAPLPAMLQRRRTQTSHIQPRLRSPVLIQDRMMLTTKNCLPIPQIHPPILLRRERLLGLAPKRLRLH